MITGIVSGRYALITLRVGGTGAPEREIEFVLDTGFVGYLALPSAAVSTLGLPFSHRMPIALADGTWTVVQVCRANLEWEEQEIEVEVLSTGGEALLGTALLDGCDVSIQFTDGGLVTIEAG